VSVAELEIAISDHARERLFERFDDRRTNTIVRHEVEAALKQGRTSRSRPFFLGPGSRAEAGTTFAWPSTQDRAYVVAENEPGVYVILTVLAPDFSSLGVGSAGAV
jgi:hypothetical protein